jgi:putative beta-lysine N-acetyltransferase
MKQDKIEKIGSGTVIQHGDLNKRVYLMKLDKADCPLVIEEINRLARANKYTKIFCKVPESAAPQFMANGFINEAQIPRVFRGTETVFFMSKFLSSDRLLEIETGQLQEFSEMLANRNEFRVNGIHVNPEFHFRKMVPGDSEAIAEIYEAVFKSYPFPIHDPEYIRKTMKNDVQYFGVETNGKTVALASAEVDKKAQNAEMTDFATLPDFRGKKLSLLLLKEMEKQMMHDGVRTLYTIARLNSLGMNKTFLRMGYTYSGTTIKNTNIAGKIESMNIYYKHIA